MEISDLRYIYIIIIDIYVGGARLFVYIYIRQKEKPVSKTNKEVGFWVYVSILPRRT